MAGDMSRRERPTLTTERLSLRRPDDGDVNAIVGIVGDWEVARRLARIPHPYRATDAHFFLANIVPTEWVWALTLRGSNTLLGVIGLTGGADASSEELGYWLSSRHWNRGLATEAAGAVVRFAFQELGLAEITSYYFEDNPASGQVLRKVGFVETGREMRLSLAFGGEVPSISMRLRSSQGSGPHSKAVDVGAAEAVGRSPEPQRGA